MIGILKGMAVTLKHALDGQTFTVEYPETAPRESGRSGTAKPAAAG